MKSIMVLTGVGGRSGTQDQPKPPHRRNDSEDDYTSEKEHSFIDGRISVSEASCRL